MSHRNVAINFLSGSFAVNNTIYCKNCLKFYYWGQGNLRPVPNPPPSRFSAEPQLRRNVGGH